MLDNKLVDLDLELRHETEKAYLVFNGVKSVWLPKSQCENNYNGTFTMPKWLAVEKELI